MTDTYSKSYSQAEDFRPVCRRRFILVGFILILCLIAIISRLFFLHTITDDFLREQGEARTLRAVEVSARRGSITDRHGEPLAVSAPTYDVWVDPYVLAPKLAEFNLQALANLLDLQAKPLTASIKENDARRFLYLQRHITPKTARAIHALKIPGVHMKKTYARYYPTGEVSSHIVGFTDIDNRGQEGLELAYETELKGVVGRKKVLKDRYGRIIKEIAYEEIAQPGQDVALSIDKRIQYLAYRHLKAAVQRHQAASGSVVVADVHSGEILAMVNQPSYNPNNMDERLPDSYRNRAVTDTFEPGSTVKPFTVAAALQSDHFDVNSEFDVSPGWMRIGRFTIRDVHDYGSLSMSGIITKSSNIGIAQIALKLDPNILWQQFNDVGFGQLCHTNFPGESPGRLVNHKRWRDSERAAFAYGYGLSVTTLQLAQAYSVLANKGVYKPLTLRKTTHETDGKQIIPKHVAQSVLNMMGNVVEPGGTASQARLNHYYVGGKTGTVRMIKDGQYTDDQYHALFAGLAPLTDPRLVIIVTINEPRGEEYYGGLVAAPVFSKVLAGSVRLMNLPPDNVNKTPWGKRDTQSILADNS